MSTQFSSVIANYASNTMEVYESYDVVYETEAELQRKEFDKLCEHPDWWTARTFLDWVERGEWEQPELWIDAYDEWRLFFDPIWLSVCSFTEQTGESDMRLNEWLTGNYGELEPSVLNWLGTAIPDWDWLKNRRARPFIWDYNSGMEARALYSDTPTVKPTKSVRKAWAEAKPGDYWHNKRLWADALQLIDPNLIVKVLKDVVVDYPIGVDQRHVATVAMWVGVERFINLLCKPQTRTSVEEVDGEMVRREVPVESWFLIDIFKMVEIYDQAQSDWVNGLLQGVGLEELTPSLGRIRSMQQLHNELAPQAVAIQKEVILHQEEIADFDGLEWEGYTIVVPVSSRQIALWGKIHHHCVGTYTHRINNHQAKVFGLFQDGELVWTGSIVPHGSDWRLEQLMGTYNAPAPKELQAGVASLFEVDYFG